jgi:hypothetical protein
MGLQLGVPRLKKIVEEEKGEGTTSTVVRGKAPTASRSHSAIPMTRRKCQGSTPPSPCSSRCSHPLRDRLPSAKDMNTINVHDESDISGFTDLDDDDDGVDGPPPMDSIIQFT